MAAMDRDGVMKLVQDHLVAELEVKPELIKPETRFREDLDADSLDLYELVMELEDHYGIRVSEEDAAEIKTVGDAVEFVCAHAPAG
jgi:acyl carrier protein